MALQNAFPTDPNTKRESLHLFIRGRVQGVGFRYFTLQMARQRNLAGWVKNLPDGRVEAQAQGPRRALSEWTQALRQGPPGSTVEDIVAEWGSVNDGRTDFEILP